MQSQQQRAAEYLEQRVEAMQQDIRDDPTHTGEYLEQRVEAIRSAVQSQQQRAAEYLEQRIKNKEQQQRPKGRKGMGGEIWSVSNIANYLGMANSTCHTALKNGDIPGTWQDGSRWKLSIEKYEQSKFNKQ